MNDERFDRLVDELRQESVPPEEIETAQDRVWERLVTHSSVCEKLRPEIPDYLAHRLAEPRRLLVEDHLSRCVECRHELTALKGEGKVVEHPAAGSARSGWWRWAAAAAVVLVALYIGRDTIDSALAPSGPRATVASVSGTLHRLSGTPLEAGFEIGEGEVVRTTAGSRAVLQLADGSRLEMNQRTELAVHGAWSGDTIRLGRGDVIVEAAEQGARRLRVVTGDSIAAVRGTIFAVSSGTAGSLVSVVEGSVEVSQPGFEKVLSAGQQAASTAALAQVSPQQAISWSQEAEDYYALLGELVEIEQEVAALPWPALRHEAGLVPYLPPNTFAYVSVPNLEGTIGDILDLVDQRARQSEVLAEWWSSSDGGEVRELVEYLEALTPMLGDEIVLTISGDPGSAGGEIPLVLAEVEPGREADLVALIDSLADGAEEGAYRIADGLLLVSDDPANLAMLAAQLGGGAASGLADAVRARYEHGVGWLAAVDVDSLGLDRADSDLGYAVGLANMRYLVFEQKNGGAGDSTEMTLSFDGPRVGMASWLAEPGAIGSAEYVSPETLGASASATRDPREAFDQLIAAAGSQSELANAIREFEQETGIDIGDDIASSLGTDFVFAVERLSVPVPDWVLVMEVLNPATLDNAVRRLVDTVNAHLDADEADHRLSFVEETINGRTWKSLSSADAEFIGVSWTYDRGYLVASVDRGPVLRAIGVRDSGSSLIRSSAFLQRYPAGTRLHASGFFWLNAGGVLGQLAELTASPAVAELAGRREPLLVVVTGEDDRIRWASSSRLSSIILDLMLAGPAGALE